MDTESTFRPPYMSFQTFWNYIEELAEKPLPPAIDRSIMKTKSGTDQANLTMAFTSFGLTDAEGTVQPSLIRLVEASPEERPTVFADMVHVYYSAPLSISFKNGTPADLTKAFTDEYPSIASADTRRKSITFFLHAARKAGIELSPHFPQTRGGSGAPGVPKAKRSAPRKKSAPNGQSTPPQARVTTTTGDTYTVDLPSGGSVSVVVDVNLFGLTTEDRNFVIELVDKLKGYPTAAQPAKPREADAS